ncbi:MAG: septal ring lytic transglycosylase RlpA family protein [Actinobacteria bacterium]|nr:septal ring lytic transglycosylase RlpA family protein [Actinomycetota bacterium]
MVLVPMSFSPAGGPAPPTEVSVAAALPDDELVADDVGTAAFGPDEFDVDVDIDVDIPPPESTTTMAPPETTTTTVETTTTTAPPETTTTTAPSTTTTVPLIEIEVDTTAHTHPEPPPTTTTTAAPPPPPPSGDDDVRSQEGQASWYDLPGSRAGVCAHRTIAKGTVVTVRNLDTGKSITCTVDDRGPYADGKIIDLYRDDFARLAPLSQGVFPTRITW